MAGRREVGSGSTVEGFHTGDTTSYGKHVMFKDRKRKNECNRKGSRLLVTPSPPMEKVRQSFGYHSNASTRRHSSEQRLYSNKGISSDGLECIEKDVNLLSKERKKLGHVSLSHLLNFTVSHSDRVLISSDHSASTTTSSGSKRMTRRHSSYNKEQFLQANCQFVVRESGDYSIHVTESDLLVDWNNIEQIRLFCHEMASCPICLHLPTAAKITRCGHIFCYSCVLHYLALSEKKWRKCPICYESIYKQDLRSVTTFASKKYEVNDVISMSLMKRKKGTTIVMPCEDWDDSFIKIKRVDDKYKSHFSKLVVASSSEVLIQTVQPEILELEEQLSLLSVHEESEKCYIEEALKDVKLRMDSVNQDTCISQLPINEDSKLSGAEVVKGEEICNLYEDSSTCTDTHVCTYDAKDESIKSQSEPDSDSSSCSLQSVSPQKGYVYFYQASDGQNLYIHPLNGKALVTEFGSWDKCPNTISGRVVEIEHYTMTEEERIRSKYLNHLPLTCEFAFCELELGPLLSSKTEELFQDQVLKRKQKRQKRRREEKRLEKKQKNQSGIVYSPSTDDVSVPEKLHDFLSIASSPPLPSLIDIDLNPIGISSSTRNSGMLENPSVKQPSFAQALTHGDKGIQSPNVSRVGIENQETWSDNLKEEESVPSFQNSFSNALLTGTAHAISNENHGGKPRGSKSAKKGRKKIVLFSTAGGNHRI